MSNQQPDGKISDISLRALVLASLASVIATFVVARFGLAGTMAGAAIFPIVLILVRELGHRPAERIVRRGRTPEQADPLSGTEDTLFLHDPEQSAAAGPSNPRPEPPTIVRLHRSSLRWRRVLATAGAAFAITVGAFTVSDLFVGESVVSDRRTTFLSTKPAPSQPTPSPASPSTLASPTANGEKAAPTDEKATKQDGTTPKPDKEEPEPKAKEPETGSEDPPVTGGSEEQQGASGEPEERVPTEPEASVPAEPGTSTPTEPEVEANPDPAETESPTEPAPETTAPEDPTPTEPTPDSTQTEPTAP